MKRCLFIGIILSISLFEISCKKVKAPAACGPVPTENQMRWQEMEYYAFLHFSLNTYTDQSWGFGNEDVALFNPTELDARQWARICKEAGMKGIIVTAKHHCGFCLWPSAYTEYSVKNAPWKDGKGDVIHELADACKEYGLKLGIYLSPWDRNHADYGKPEYITYFRNQLKELLTNYGDIFEVWYDGANGGTGWYGGANENRKIDRTTYYDWKNTYKLVRELQPNIVIWNDGGDRADLRWVGTEGGWVGETNWSLLNATGDVPFEMLHYGVENGDSWVPAEVNTSIRPEWFYHPSEDTKVKTLPQLMDTYYNSVGRNATFLLNFPIMPNGLIHPNDEKAALDLAAAVKEAFAVNLVKNAKTEADNFRGNSKKFGPANVIDDEKDSYWATDDDVKTASLTIDFGKPTTFNRFMAQEYIRLGQRIKAFTVEALVDGNWKEIAKATTIGYKRILRFPTVTATQLRFSITDSKACPVISNVGVYNAPQILTAPAIIRNQAGEVNIIPADAESEIYYTLDGSEPTKNSVKYTGPVQTEGKIKISAISVEPSTGKSSVAATEEFGMPRKDWKIVGIEDENVYRILDGNIATAWRHREETKLPVDLVIDLGKEQMLTGFKYYPEQNSWQPGIITNYEFSVSVDGKKWKLVSEGEFSNIKNNPLWQTKNFEAVNARFIKFRALKNTENNNRIGYAEIDVITAEDLKLYTIKGQVKLNVERPTPTSACLSLSNKSLDKRTCTRERGTFVIDSVNAGLYSLHINGYGSENIDTLINVKGTNKIIELELLVQCEINSSVAKYDIKNNRPRLLVNGGIAPANIPNKDLFEKKYGVKYDDMGDVPPPYECLKQYNNEVFKYLDSKFGESWKTEISTEVVGFEKSE